MTTKSPAKLRYANAANLHIAAVINGAYRFDTPERAAQKLAAIKKLFTTSRVSEDEVDANSLTLWIRQYDVADTEEAAGFLGNFAKLTIEKIKEEGLYTLVATKVEKPLKNHPLRRRPAARCPNWGHPILRGIKKGKQYPNLELANNELTQLHLEYPETTIPANNKLYLMIFSRQENPKQPIERYVLEIKNLQGGGFTIEWKKNEFKRKTPIVVTGDQATNPAPTKDPATMGHFASLVSLKRKKKTDKK
jgi:hypothetical protein